MTYWIGFLNLALIAVIFAASLNLLVGFTGVFSVGSAGFAAVGGYVTAQTAISHDLSLWQLLVMSAAVSALLGCVVSVPLLRLTQDYTILLTLATAQLVVIVIVALPELGGLRGLFGIPAPHVGSRVILTPEQFLSVFSIVTVMVLAVIWRVGESPYGRLLRAIGDDELAVRSLGKNAASRKFVVFAISSGCTGVGGALLVLYNQIAAPSLFSFDVTMLIFASVVVGGIGSLPGSILGALVVTFLDPVLQQLLTIDPQRASLLRPVIFGVLLILMMRYRPAGLVPARHRRVRLPKAGRDLIGAPTAAVIGGAAPRVLAIDGLSKRFGGVQAVSELTLTLRPGQITVLIGPNGAGKSTVFNLVTGAFASDSGQVKLSGEDVTGWRPDRLARAGVVRSFQDVRVFPNLTALENVMVARPNNDGEKFVRLFLPTRRVAQAERRHALTAAHWLRFVGLEDCDNEPAKALSFAQQKLVALARALATDAEILLLDEPLSGIEGQAAEHLLEVLERIRETGRTVCLVEHNVQAVRRLADWTYFMELGTITAEGPIEELLADKRLTEAYFGA